MKDAMQPRISMITLAVRDLPAAIAFYEHGLGFPRMDSPPEVAFFTLDGTWLALYGREALAEDATVSARGEGFEGFTLAHNVGSEREVDAVVAQAVRRRRDAGQAAAEGVLGRLQRLLQGSRRPSLGGGVQPVLLAGAGVMFKGSEYLKSRDECLNQTPAAYAKHLTEKSATVATGL